MGWWSGCGRVFVEYGEPAVNPTTVRNRSMAMRRARWFLHARRDKFTPCRSEYITYGLSSRADCRLLGSRSQASCTCRYTGRRDYSCWRRRGAGDTPARPMESPPPRAAASWRYQGDCRTVAQSLPLRLLSIQKYVNKFVCMHAAVREKHKLLLSEHTTDVWNNCINKSLSCLLC